MSDSRIAWIAGIVALCSGPGAFAHERYYEGELSGAAQFPPNGSTATGSMYLTLDLDLATLRIQVSFEGLAGPVTAAHFHGQTAAPHDGLADMALHAHGFPLGGVSGSYDHTLNLGLPQSYTPEFIAASGGTVGQAFNALIAGLEAERMYFNIHTAAYPGGEVRTFTTRVRVHGDLNCDGHVTNFDIDAFVLALVQPAQYAAIYVDCDPLNGDMNHDELLNNFDIDGFVVCLLTQECGAEH